VVLPAAAVSLLASGPLMLGGHATIWLFVGRLLAGIASGAVFSAGTTWVREASLARAEGPSAAGRAAVAMTAGFGLGPLVAGAIAQWAPAPTVLPYLPHMLIMVAVLALLWPAAAPTVARPTATATGPRAGIFARSRFRGVVIPLAPWVFAAPTIAFALLPTVVGIGEYHDGIVFAAAITALTALAGVLVQPLARRLDGIGPAIPGVAGLLTLAAGLALGVAAVADEQAWMLVPSGLVLGGAYGLCLVAGLTEVQQLAARPQLARATSAYYALTYLGFAAPYVLTSASALATYTALLTAAALLALATAATIAVQNSRHPRGR
jgi:hypothetical protein